MLIRSFKAILALFFLQLVVGSSFAQPLGNKQMYTHADTLRGSIGAGRMGWDVLHYEITVTPDYNTKTISGINRISFLDTAVFVMQIDLQEPMLLDSVIREDNTACKFTREGNVYWVEFRDPATKPLLLIAPGKRSINIYFHGKPREAIRPPWDGGWIWKKDKQNNPWMSVACQGLGSSVWYPCKDTQSDEPDNGATLHMIVPDSLVAVGNGRLKESHETGNNKKMYTWEVKSAINNYNIIPYIGKYVHFGEVYPGIKGKLDMDYWVLDYNLEKAKKQFTDAPRMMKAFEYWFGPYPFYEDSYKLVEAPHLGMEHQSATAYGNGYMNGYMGNDFSESGWGLKWDFIIIHESGHEWFANSITSKDIADMWIHESFTNYSETLFTDYYYGTKAGDEYLVGTRKKISNDIPIIGKYGINQEGSGDMYAKGGNMLHSIRQVIKSDKKFRSILMGLNKKFYHQTVNTAQVEQYISQQAGFDFSKIFDQYLRTVNIPVLQYKVENNRLSYRWTNTVPGFNMPVKVSFGKKEKWITPSADWKTISPGKSYDGSFVVNKNFYITSEKVQ